MEGTGEGSEKRDTSSLLAAPGKTSLIKSSEANRSSFKLRSLPTADEVYSDDSRETIRTGVGVADLAVLGLKSSLIKIS